MTAPAAVPLSEGAQFATIIHGGGQSAVINLDCSIRHVADHLASVLEVDPTSDLDLASDRGRLMDIPAHTAVEEQATTLLKSRCIYVPVIVSYGLSSKNSANIDREGSSNPSRPSSSRSVSSQRGSRKTMASRTDDSASSQDGGDSKKQYHLLLDTAIIQAKFPAFELTTRNGIKVKKSAIFR